MYCKPKSHSIYWQATVPVPGYCTVVYIVLLYPSRRVPVYSTVALQYCTGTVPGTWPWPGPGTVAIFDRPYSTVWRIAETQTTETVSFTTLLNGRYIVLQVYLGIIKVQLSSLMSVDRGESCESINRG